MSDTNNSKGLGSEPLTLETLKQLLIVSATRSGQSGLPWKAENEQISLETWMAVLEGLQIRTTSSLARLLNVVHGSRRAQDLGRPVTLDHLVYVHQRLKANLTWSVREEKWLDQNGGWRG